MPARRLITFLVVATICLAPGSMTAQTPSPPATAPAVERLFTVTIPREALPEAPVALSWDELWIAPGTAGTLDADEAFSGRGIYVLEGEMTLTLPFDAMAWHGAAATDGDAITVAAGEALRLVAGDLVYLPHRPAGDTSAPTLTIANEGAAVAHGVGFRLRAGDTHMRSSVPDGVRTHATMATIVDPALFATGPVTFALDRFTLERGQSLQPDPATLTAFYQVVSGRIAYSWTTPDGETTITYTWAPRVGRWLPWASDVGITLTPADDEAATLLVLRVEPVSPP